VQKEGLPNLPDAHARYISIGAPQGNCQASIYAWLLQQQAAHYQYFIFLTSSIKGPFIPAYAAKVGT
jgi:hypothetical protein